MTQLDCKCCFHKLCLIEYIKHNLKNNGPDIRFDKGIRCPYLDLCLDYKKYNSLLSLYDN